MEKANAMRELRKNGASRKSLADHFGVSEATVKKVLSGAYWSPTVHPAVEKIAGPIASALKK
jgi:lambda repressor-like predicted transcriptional regulator